MKPISIRHGSVTVKIYSTPRAGYDGFTVVWKSAEGLKRKLFGDLNEARTHAQSCAALLASGLGSVASLSPAQAVDYIAARDLAPGGDILDAAKVAARLARECPGVPVGDLIAHWNRTRKAIDAKTAAEILPEMIRAKRQDRLSSVYLADLQNRLDKFARRFPGAMSSVRGADIDDWLRESDLSPQSRRNYRTVISTLASFAKRRGWLPLDWDECSAIDLGRTDAAPVNILTPEQLGRLVNDVSPGLRAYIAIGAWAGVRTAEIQRLTWADVGPEYLTVEASKAKTAARRLVPILPPLRAFLSAQDREGPLIGCKFLKDRITTETRKLGIDWSANNLRHSFCSYRLAQTQNAAQVAMEAGNSPTMIFRHYRELVTPAAAALWFSISVINPSSKA